ncbi:MAG: carbohydrate porin [Deltaproteobacteria bacterium]|nr:MAG: carbohydrate porin [Deltaproteobacteria bacterium]
MEEIKIIMFRWTTLLCLAFIVSLVLGLAQPVLAQQEAPESTNEQATKQEVAATGEQSQKTKSGYQDESGFGGPSSTGAQLEEDNLEKVPLLRFPGIDQALEPWFDWKGRLNKDYGLQFGFDYTALYQGVTDSPGEDSAAGGIFRFFGNWTLVGHGGDNSGSIVFKLENRHRLGTDVAPQDLGFEAGYLGIPGTAFSDYRWGVTNLYWQQRFREGEFNFIAGVVDVTDYIDIYGLTNPWTQFQNLVFLTNPTIPAPNQGLGAAFGAMTTDNIYVVGGLADANGDPTEPGDWFDTFFNDHEYFYHLEVGWVSSFARRYFDNIHLTAWHVDERDEVQVDDGWGLAFSATTFINDKWMPFLRAGYSDDGGALLEASISAGIGYYMSDSRYLLGFGVNWGRPPDSGLDDQYTAEIFYRLQLAQNLAITPDVQLIIDPALNPDENTIWVFGLRARLAL